MPNPSLNSFLQQNVFKTETVQAPLYAAFLAGSTYNPPVFNGKSGASSIDPGGLFGWLIHSRGVVANPIKGSTGATYISYSNVQDFVNDLNTLGGITYALISQDKKGGTYGLFTYSGSILSGTTIGYDFLYALNYLAYGGTLIIAGTCSGFVDYQTTSSNLIDVLIGQTANASLAQYVETTPNVIGIFPSINNGLGYTAAKFDNYFTDPTYVTYISGATVADRIFNVYGQSLKNQMPTSTLLTGSSITYTLSSVSDAAGAFTRSKNTKNQYLTVAGLEFSKPLNSVISNPVDWNSKSTKNILKKNRVNFYSKSTDYFLGLDVVGSTAGTDSTYTSDERIGPAVLKNTIESNVTTIALKYIFDINNAITRGSVTTEIKLFMNTLESYLDPAYTQIICNDTNNTDNSSVLYITIVAKPIIATTEFSLNIALATA
jgi:hypothetical protein